MQAEPCTALRHGSAVQTAPVQQHAQAPQIHAASPLKTSGWEPHRIRKHRHGSHRLPSLQTALGQLCRAGGRGGSGCHERLNHTGKRGP
jgi:hypothetical protein